MRIPALLLILAFCGTCSAETLVYFGTYTKGNSSSEGIYVCNMNETRGELSAPRLAAPVVDPSFVAIHPNGKTLYAVSETAFHNEQSIGLVSFRINADGTLTKLNERSTRGGAACHLAIHPSGRCLGVANYMGGSCASFPILNDGSLGAIASFFQHEGKSVHPGRQNAPHGHSFNFNDDGTQAFVADLGLDKILIYDVDGETGKMTRAKQAFLDTPPGGGPRHFCFAPSGDLALTNLELTSQVALLNYRPSTKTLSLGMVISTLPPGHSPSDDGTRKNSTAECLVHPNGKIAYVSNRGHNSIAVIRLNRNANEIRLIQNQPTGGEIPRGFGIDPSGKFLVVANQSSDNVVSMRIDANSGKLSPSGSEIQIGTPVNVRFLKR